jgi:dTDP-4-dehydrorhamnose 3,5-epimerase
MEVKQTKLPGVLIIQPRVFGDQRGFFLETFSSERYAEHGITGPFVQDNWSRSRRGVLRGLHYQLRQTQGKLVQVLRGEIFDVAVDVRRSSPTFGQWAGTTLSEQNKRQFWIPPGFAHGFVVLSEEADFVYKCTDYYAPAHERTLIWNDPTVGIEWPHSTAPQLSEKDRAGKLLQDVDVFE